MYNYNIAFVSPCKVGNDNFSSDLFTKLWKRLTDQFPKSCTEKYFTHDELPEPLCRARNNLFRLLLVPWSLSNQESFGQGSKLNKNEWFDFSEIQNHDVILDYLCKELDKINWNELDYANITAEQLQNIADSLTESSYCANIFWLTCGHAQCIESRENIAIHNALEHLTRWNTASVTFVCNSEIIRSQEFTDAWFKTHMNIHVVSQAKKLLQDNNIVWQGCLEYFRNDEKEECYDWCLSRAMCAPSSQFLETSLSYVGQRDKLSLEMEDRDYIFAHTINVICELPKNAVPVWKIQPFQFVLYHKSQLQRVLELQEKTPVEALIERKDTLVLSSIESYQKRLHQRPPSTSKDSIELITCEPDQKQNKLAAIETHHLVLYAVEPGIFSAYFVRPEGAFIKLSSQLVIHHTLDLFDESVKAKTVLDEDTLERQWLQLLNATQRLGGRDSGYIFPNPPSSSCQKSPIKSQLSLPVHLNATEMLKHFTKDGKPKKQELKLRFEQLQEKRNMSPKRQTDIKNHFERKAGVQYCPDDFSNASPSVKLHPKYETLSICNTPRTVAKSKMQDVKRRLSTKTETKSSSDTEQSSMQLEPSSMQLEQSTGKFPDSGLPKIDIEELSNGLNDKSASSSSTNIQGQLEALGRTRSSIDQINKEIQPRSSTGTKNASKTKRRSFDGNERLTAADENSNEKRSDRHKRRLARVVKRALIKYGADPTEGYFTTSSERLYYLCKSFLKDLKTSEGLNKEMKRLAEANVSTVVEFEKRQYASKFSNKMKTSSRRTTNS